MIYLQLFYEFFKTGLFAFGGGMATIPFLYDMSLKTGWFTSAQLTNMIAISESTPGPIGANMATYVGFTTAGIAGGVIATLGLITPSIIIILLVARILAKYRSNVYVDGAFKGLRPASLGLISAAGLEVFKTSLLDLDGFQKTGQFISLFNLKSILLAVVVFLAIRKFKGHPIFYIIGSAVVGIAFKMAG